MDILLIGSSFSAVPMLCDLKRRGARVTVVGKYKDDPCHTYADKSIYIDYSDPMVLRDLCRDYTFDGIVPSCNDYAYLAAANVAAEFGYPGFDKVEVVKILHEKDRFRRFCAKIDIPAPRLFCEIEGNKHSYSKDIVGTALVKPVDSFSGRGVERVSAPEGLPDAIDRALCQSRSNRAVVEEFVNGTLHSHTALISGGRIVWHEFVDEFCEIYAFQVDRSNYPSNLPHVIRARVHESLSMLVQELGLVDGLLHTQFIASEERFWIIECMRRCPGDLYGHHFYFAEGRDYAHAYVSAFLGIPPEAPAATKPMRRVERKVLSVGEVLPMFGVTVSTNSQHATFIPLKESGHKLEAAPFDKAGILFFEGQEGENLTQSFPKIKAGIVYHELPPRSSFESQGA